MTHPIQQGPFSRAAPKLGKSRQTLSSSEVFRTGQTYLLSALLITSSITTPWGKPSNIWTSWVYSLRPRVPNWIWIRWIQSASHRNNFTSPLISAMSTTIHNSAQTSSNFIPGQHFLEAFTLLFPQTTRTTHPWADYIIPILNQQTRLLLHLWRPYLTHSTMP